MKRLIKRYVRRQIALYYHCGDMDTLNQCADFVFNAPIWHWRFRLRLVLRKPDFSIETLERLFRFACH